MGGRMRLDKNPGKVLINNCISKNIFAKHFKH
jgi:hypothetical protein